MKRTYESFEWEYVSLYIATRAAYFLTSADWRFQRCLEADDMHSAVCQARRNAKHEEKV